MGGVAVAVAVADGGLRMAVADGGRGWRSRMAVADGGRGWRSRMAGRGVGAAMRGRVPSSIAASSGAIGSKYKG